MDTGINMKSNVKKGNLQCSYSSISFMLAEYAQSYLSGYAWCVAQFLN